METVKVPDYEKELEEQQRIIREEVLKGYEDVKAGKGREAREFFDELEIKYRNAKI